MLLTDLSFLLTYLQQVITHIKRGPFDAVHSLTDNGSEMPMCKVGSIFDGCHR